MGVGPKISVAEELATDKHQMNTDTRSVSENSVTFREQIKQNRDIMSYVERLSTLSA